MKISTIHVTGHPPIDLYINNSFISSFDWYDEYPNLAKPLTWSIIDSIQRGTTKVKIIDGCDRSLEKVFTTCPDKCDYYIKDDGHNTRIHFSGFDEDFYINVQCPYGGGGVFGCFWLDNNKLEVKGIPPVGFKFSVIWPNGDSLVINNISGFASENGYRVYDEGEDGETVTIIVKNNNGCTLNIPITFDNQQEVLNFISNGYYIIGSDKCEICHINGVNNGIYAIDGDCEDDFTRYIFEPNSPFKLNPVTLEPDYLGICNEGGKICYL